MIQELHIKRYKMKNLYIHIGMPKTGSSAIQAFLACNNDKLKTVDYCYPWHPGFGQAFQTSAGNATSLHHWILDKNFDELVTKINSLPQNNIILSSEILFHTARLHPKSFSEALKGFNIKVICYIRKIDDLIDSCVNQLVKNHGMTDYSDLETIINDHDYATTLIELSKHIDKKLIDVRIYDRSKFTNNDIYEDILEATDLNKLLSKNKLTEPEKKINPSLVPEAFEIRKHLNSIKFNTANDQSKYTFNGVLALYSVNAKKTKFSILTKEERLKVFKLFENREIELNRVFFGRENRIFSEITDIKKPDVSHAELSLVLLFIYENSKELFNSIIDKISETTYSPLLINIIEKYVIVALPEEEKIRLLPLIKSPLISILPYNFSSLTHSYSKDMTFENIEYATRIKSTGNDPYYSFRSVDINGSNTYIIITLNSNVECRAQLHYQTISEPSYGNKKFQLKKIKPGYNELKFTIKNDELNGSLRFDPIMCEGVIDIYNTTIF